MFAGKAFLGCDMRPGPGVDRIEDVSAIGMADESVGAVLCIETFEHVFEIRRAFDEVYRILAPGGIFVFTSPLNFRIHAYPDDYWRMTPSCLKRMMRPYAARIVGAQGVRAFPHSVMAMGIKGPAPADFADRARALAAGYDAFLAQAEAAVPLRQKIRRRLGMLYRSKGERQAVAGYYHSEFSVETGAESVSIPIAAAGRELRVDPAVDASPIPTIHDAKGQGAWRHTSIVY
jgi:SAM-dependent methyltransferase